VSSFDLSLDGKTLALRVGNGVRALPASADAKSLSSKDAPGRETGWVDLERLRVAVVPLEEWRQMFREAWRLQRDQFWTSDMSGVEWRRVLDRYLPLVDRCATRAEFSDLMWEMQGELNTSHAYEMGGDYRPEPQWHLGHLGADLALDEEGRWVVRRVPRGDSWDPARAAPLSAPGVLVRPGDAILAVDGEAVGPDASPAARLVHAAARDVRLTVRSAADGAVRTVAVRTLREEHSLRYRDWVEANRARVHEATGGRVGYVHVPNMGPVGYAEFHRYYLAEVDRAGLVVDVRWNGGGHVSQLLLEKLARVRRGYSASRWMAPSPYPDDAPMGPMVALTNEYAGSDGDMFSHNFKSFGLGPLIGKRTWGGVVGIWPRHALVDGTLTTQPEFAHWFHDVGWRLENYGTEPDVEVEIRPQDHAAGRDPQLERAIAEVTRLVETKSPTVPDLARDRPVRRPPSLPKTPA
jgi:tricorn protease